MLKAVNGTARLISKIENQEGLANFDEKNEWVGLITFYIKSDTCEITSLDSLQENKGIGTRLIQAVAGEAVKSKCKRVFLVTTNDNLRALGFYQKRGFRITAVHSSAIDEARKVKPAIPHIGLNGIPLRDEIDFELLIK
jgi:GNAT superfamily N-acetyltransferase